MNGTLENPGGPAVSGGFANGNAAASVLEYYENGHALIPRMGRKTPEREVRLVPGRSGRIKGQFLGGAVHGQVVEYNKNGVKLYEGGF